MPTKKPNKSLDKLGTSPAVKKAAAPKKASAPKAAGKVKVGELAKKHGKTSKEILALLKDLGIAAKTALSSIDQGSAKIVEDLLTEAPKPVLARVVTPPPAAKSEPVLAPSKVEGPVPPPAALTPAPTPVPKPAVPKAPAIVIDTPDIIVKDLAEKLSIRVADLLKEFLKKNILLNLNQRVASDLAVEVAKIFNKEITLKLKDQEKKLELSDILSASKEENLKLRPPIVTILGHVDHGKTKLLDAIRSTKVAESEAGGITQHIGAYQVEIKGRKITFLDTPGHAAFTALRARGAKATDVAVLVVAADDGVMPQTIEAIDHAKAAGVPIIVAINKIDKPEANADKVKQQLTEYKLVSEDWGGDTIMVPLSAKQKQGIDSLLEMILLVADVQELKADPGASATGVVIESRLDKGRGPVATVLIKNGTLRVGEAFTVGQTHGKVRAMLTEFGERLKTAPPSTPVEFLGASDVPQPGDVFQVMPNEKEARQLAEQRKSLHQKIDQRRPAHTLEDFSEHVNEGERADIKLILKTDVQGTLEALRKSLGEIEVHGNRASIIHEQAGAVTESDVLLAEASGAVIIGFNTTVDPRAKVLAAAEAVDIRLYNIIYKVIDDIKLALEGMLKPIFEEVVVGVAEVRQTFRFSKVGSIAGCFVTSGKMTRGAGLRIKRDNQVVYEGKLEALKRFKEDVREVAEGYECGVSIQGHDDFKVGDILECFEMKQVNR